MKTKNEKIKHPEQLEQEAVSYEYGDIFPEYQPEPKQIPFPWGLFISGTYEQNRILRPYPYPKSDKTPVPGGEVAHGFTEEMGPATEEQYDTAYGRMEEAEPSGLYPFPFRSETLKLDVDGRYPQMTASGTITYGLRRRINWIAKLRTSGKNEWTGKIWYKQGTLDMPYTTIRIKAYPNMFRHRHSAIATFFGGMGIQRRVNYRYKSRYFHPIEFEYDWVEDAPMVTKVHTTAHPNHPAGLPSEILSIETVYKRSGFNVSVSPESREIPLSAADTDALWSDAEMHDAMQDYWSRFADKPQWAMWVLFASEHVWGTGLGGIMFDDIGPNHRQGTSIFGNAFISVPPPGDPAPEAWVQRMRFWTAVHEMGHAFNLAHSWQKDLGNPWIPLVNEPEARSFMNYPDNVNGGQSAFFADFEYRFSDKELLFLRHAPYQFVQPGNADWFDDHGFEQANAYAVPTFKLELRSNRQRPVFEFLEPVVLELKLTNISSQPKVFNKVALTSSHDTTVIIKRHDKAARQWIPYADYCTSPQGKVLEMGKSIYHPLVISAGLNGWDIAEPGIYTVQVAVKNGEEEIVSNPLQIRIAPPRKYDEEYLAQDLFTEDVGRVIAMNGSRTLNQANDTLKELMQKLPETYAAYHARIALGTPLSYNYKKLSFDDGKGFQLLDKNVDEATIDLGITLIDNADKAVETMGNINYKRNVDRYCEFLSSEGSFKSAGDCQEKMFSVLSNRKVLKEVLDEIQVTKKAYMEKQ